jgi:chaperonin GroEL
MGVVPGGGACMLYLSGDEALKQSILAACSDDEDERLGVEIMFRSLPAPMKQIAKNAGLEGEVVAEKCRGKPFGFGYNAQTDVYEDLMETGVLDPAKVTINALENAASIAALVLTTEVLITEIPKKEVPMPMDPNYM